MSRSADAAAGPTIVVRDLRKTYGELDAVGGISFEVARGEVFALLGPNGAGKTTTTEILEGFRPRTAGEIEVLGRDPGRADAELKSRIGIVLQSTGVDAFLTVRETVEFYRGLYPAPRDGDEVIRLVGLTEKRDVKVTKLSGGQKRRLDVAIALAGDPELLFLDEPTTGFDPSARRNAWEIVKSLAELGKTVFLTTHFMDEAQYLADRVAIIARGSIVAEGTPDTLGGRDTAKTHIRFRLPAGIAAAGLPQIGQRTAPDGAFLAEVEDPVGPLHQLTGWASEHRVRFEVLEVSRPSLEDVYLAITGGDEVTES
ncbi:MAG: ABC transporter ATP-binding protein [Actinomycetota bacterium]